MVGVEMEKSEWDQVIQEFEVRELDDVLVRRRQKRAFKANSQVCGLSTTEWIEITTECDIEIFVCRV